MIVLCPSCQTRYRHQPSAGALASTAWCSRCDERFPLAPAKRTYIVRPKVAQDGFAAAAAVHGPRAMELGLRADGPPRDVSRETAATPPTPPTAMPTADSPGGEPTATPGLSAFVEFLVAVVPASGGAAMAYHLAERQGQDPITWAALGGAIGLLLGWACLLWIGRDD